MIQIILAVAIVVLCAVLYARHGDIERHFIDYTDKAIQEEIDKINQRKNAGREWGAK